MKEFPRKEVFKVLKVNDSSFYRWREMRLKKEEDDEMKAKIGEVFWRHGRKYGSRRIYFELLDDGISG